MSPLELEIQDMKKRLDDLESMVWRLAGDPAPPPVAKEITDPEQLIAWMKAEGLIIDPPEETLAQAERWRALPEEEKQAILWELDHLPPGPMASDIIIENRR